MTAPVPALSTSADVEAVLNSLRSAHSVGPGCYLPEGWHAAVGRLLAAVDAAALSTPPTEGSGVEGPTELPRNLDVQADAPTSATGAREGSALEHRVVWEPKPGLEVVCSCGAHLSCYGLTTPIGSIYGNHLRAAIAQDADRTSRGGALTEDEREALDFAARESRPRLFAAVERILAARATRAAPDDQAEGER